MDKRARYFTIDVRQLQAIYAPRHIYADHWSIAIHPAPDKSRRLPMAVLISGSIPQVLN